MNALLFSLLFISAEVGADPTASESVSESKSAASAKQADVERDFVFSAIGPGEDHTAIGLGVRFLPFPTIDFHVAYGITENLNLVADIATLGFFSVGDIGVRYRLGDEKFSLGFKALGDFMHVELGDARGLIAGIGPGFSISTGSQSFQFTLGFDVPMYYFGAAAIDGVGAGAATGFAYLLKPNLAFEFKIGESTNLYLQSDLYLAPQGADFGFLPTVALGVSW